MSISRTPIRRAKPLLGTTVAISIAGLPDDEAHAAIERGFAAVAQIHELMSFHEPQSDLSRLNRTAAQAAVEVRADTFKVLQVAQTLSEKSDGVFDITMAGR